MDYINDRYYFESQGPEPQISQTEPIVEISECLDAYLFSAQAANDEHSRNKIVVLDQYDLSTTRKQLCDRLLRSVQVIQTKSDNSMDWTLDIVSAPG